MCYGHQIPFDETLTSSPRNLRSPATAVNAAAVAALRGRLAETEARLARARAREAQLSRELDGMKRFVAVMEIVEGFLNRRYIEQRDLAVASLLRRSLSAAAAASD